MEIKNVLIDTCFLIELADTNAQFHQNAIAYLAYFNNNNISCYLSPIVIAEYWETDIFNDFKDIIPYFKYHSFTITEAYSAALLMRKLNTIREKNQDEKSTRVQIKDDIKIIAHFMVSKNIDAFITKDKKMLNSLFKPLQKETDLDLARVMLIRMDEPVEQTFELAPELPFDNYDEGPF